MLGTNRYHNVNINVAVQTDNGLYVPVVKVCSLDDCLLLFVLQHNWGHSFGIIHSTKCYCLFSGC